MKHLFEEKFAFRGDKGVIAHDGGDFTQYSGIPSSVELRKELGLQQESSIVGYAGSLFPGRGGEVVLELARLFSDVRFLVAGGEGEYLERFRGEIKRSGLQNVISVGFIPHGSVPRYLSACDALLMPYQRAVLHRQARHDTVDYMSPLKMFEYMASGTPIISSRLPALEEVLEDGKNALLVEPDRIEEWGTALKRILSKKGFAEGLAKQDRRDVKQYTWDKRAELIMSFAQDESRDFVHVE